MVECEPVAEREDPDRLSRTHVVGVRFFNKLGIFVVDLSDGGAITWRQWCEWGCTEVRRTSRAALFTIDTGGADRVE